MWAGFRFSARSPGADVAGAAMRTGCLICFFFLPTSSSSSCRPISCGGPQAAAAVPTQRRRSSRPPAARSAARQSGAPQAQGETDGEAAPVAEPLGADLLTWRPDRPESRVGLSGWAAVADAAVEVEVEAVAGSSVRRYMSSESSSPCCFQ